MNLDKPLDELVAGNKKPRGGARGGARGGRSGRRNTGGSKAAALGAAAANAAIISASNRNRAPIVIPGRQPGGNQGSKIIVSNLPNDVTENQVKELFATSIGPLRKVAMSFRANGTSTGQCTVEFQRADDANRAYQQYNNRLIDGKKAIKIEVVVDPARAAPVAVQQAAIQAAGRGRGAARGGRAPRPPKKTAEDLDAEMEDYAKNASSDAAPAASS